MQAAGTAGVITLDRLGRIFLFPADTIHTALADVQAHAHTHNNTTTNNNNNTRTLPPKGPTPPHGVSPSSMSHTTHPHPHNGSAHPFDQRNTSSFHVPTSIGTNIINKDELTLLQRLREGSFGVVYKGSWCGTQVAVKKLRKDLFHVGLGEGEETMSEDELVLTTRDGSFDTTSSLQSLQQEVGGGLWEG